MRYERCFYCLVWFCLYWNPIGSRKNKHVQKRFLSEDITQIHGGWAWGRAVQWMSMCARVLLRWWKYSGIAQWWWLDVPNDHWVAHFNRANYTVWLASQWQTQEGRLEPSLSAVDSGCFCFGGWLCFPMSVCAQTPLWRICRLHYPRDMSQRPFQQIYTSQTFTSNGMFLGKLSYHKNVSSYHFRLLSVTWETSNFLELRLFLAQLRWFPLFSFEGTWKAIPHPHSSHRETEAWGQFRAFSGFLVSLGG